ncbi:hypothetical protein AGMMS50256_29100 [Betaproteobacteria bacterium]|nr:hypothetical protein AGMMS50256_29100 [Betaproteobacteria bacterium]
MDKDYISKTVAWDAVNLAFNAWIKQCRPADVVLVAEAQDIFLRDVWRKAGENKWKTCKEDDYLSSLMKDGSIYDVPERIIHLVASYAMQAMDAEEEEQSIEDAVIYAGRAMFWGGVLESLYPRKQIEEKIAHDAIFKVRSDIGKKARKGRDSKPGGPAEKRKAIQAIWASGKYSTRDTCAEEEFAGLGITYKTARKALENTPNPDPWPAKKI